MPTRMPATNDPTTSGWRLVGPVAELGPGWLLYKKPRPCHVKLQHVDRLFVSAEGRRYNSLLQAQRASLLVEVHSVCSVCGSGECEPFNDIVLCDGERCGRAFHQLCLSEPLISIPVGEWLCPGCCGDEGFAQAIGVGGNGGAAAAQSRWPQPPRASVLPKASEHTEKRRLYKLEQAALRPACTAKGCGGEARHTPTEGDKTVFECEWCGTRLRSRWWFERLAGANKGSRVATSRASSSNEALPTAASAAASTSSTSSSPAPAGGELSGAAWAADAACTATSELPRPPGLLKRRARDVAALDAYFTDGPAAASRGFGPAPESPRHRSRLTLSSMPQPRASP